MLGRTTNSIAGQQAPVPVIGSRQDAANDAATWLQRWGYADAAVIRGGAGLRSSRALVQVTYLAAAVDRPELQRLAAERTDDPAKELFVFSGSGYTVTALEYADLTGMALF